MDDQLCDVCGAPGDALTPRGPLRVCPDCHAAQRRFDPETGTLIERRGDAWMACAPRRVGHRSAERAAALVGPWTPYVRALPDGRLLGVDVLTYGKGRLWVGDDHAPHDSW